MVDISIDRTDKHSNRCVDNNYDSKRINFFLSILQCTSQFSKTICQVVAYQKLKTIENSKTVNQKSGRGRLREVAFTKGSRIRL